MIGFLALASYAFYIPDNGYDSYSAGFNGALYTGQAVSSLSVNLDTPIITSEETISDLCLFLNLNNTNDNIIFEMRLVTFGSMYVTYNYWVIAITNVSGWGEGSGVPGGGFGSGGGAGRIANITEIPYIYCNTGNNPYVATRSTTSQSFFAETISTTSVYLTEQTMSDICYELNDSGISCIMKRRNWYNDLGEEAPIWEILLTDNPRQFAYGIRYCSPSGSIYRAYVGNSAANTGKEYNNENINGHIVNMDDGTYYDTSENSYNIADQIAFNTENNSYEIISGDTFIEVNYNYSYTYYIYIGSSEQYEAYEFYYDLPDGRNSADLTKEELAGLSLQFDLCNYQRIATDTATQCLYHLDGTTEDDSYYSPYTSWVWTKGSSITYLNSGDFNGCLYLDDNEHDIRLNLPNNIGTGDFTFSFRMYNAPSGWNPAISNLNLFNYILIGGSKYIYFNGEQFGGFGYNYGSNLTTVTTKLSDGQWSEICFIRLNGVLSLYYNGIRLGTNVNGTDNLNSQIKFYFQDAADNFKYIDEIRFVNFAVYDGASYNVSPVPFDTNNVFVLPETENLEPDSIAIQSDTQVAGYRVGGVRPTFPYRGLVWFPLDNDRIYDCLMWTGSYWESVGCRLWTGERWIPIWAYDVTTLQDMFDMTDEIEVPNIASEQSFWSWFIKEWDLFIELLNDKLSNLTGPSIPDIDDNEYIVIIDNDDEWNVVDVTGKSGQSLWVFVSKLFVSVFKEPVAMFGDSVDGVNNSITAPAGVFQFYTYEGVDIWD